MSSTYSTNLAIELIGTGDQSGAWGTTTNSNLGTLIEQAISGYTTQAITDGADTVLVMSPGASAVARNMVIECTGTLTAARNLVVPANKKLYFIYNNTSGGFAVTVKVSGLTGVSVPNGKKLVLMNNGTDIVVATNHMIGTLSGNVSGQLDGSLTSTTTAVTQPTTTSTTQVATTAFVQAVLQVMHPVGSIYLNASDGTNPATLLGFGTWAAFGSGQMPVGYSSGDPLFGTAGATGGSRDATLPTHTHTATSTVTDPGHNHYLNHTNQGDAFGGTPSVSVQTGPNQKFTSTSTTGVTVGTTLANAGTSATNANLPPYITVYMWKRTA